MGRQPASYQAVILGAGPAGMGPLVCAAQRGGLDALLERGIAVVERRPGMGAGTTGRFLVNADSHPGAFLECLETPGGADLFTPVRNLAATRLLQQQRCAPVPLGLVAKYLDHLGSVLARRLVAHRRSDFFANTQARAIYLDRHGGLRIRIHCLATQTPHELRARAVVVALGGYPPLRQFLQAELAPGLRLGDCARGMIMSSHELLTAAGLAKAGAWLRANQTPRPGASVVILGGSHSAFSCAWALLHGPSPLGPPRFSAGNICIGHRSPVRIFYPTRAAALQDGYADFDEHDLCPLTRRVHRLGGLRGDGRQLGRQLLGLGQQPAERRVHLLPLAATSAAELRQLVRRAALIVPAFGYRPQLIPIFGADGKPIELFASAPGRGTAPRVDSHCRVLDRRGVAIPGVYALGLGWGFSPWGAMGGEPSFHGHTNGVWLYQNDLGALILRQVAASA